MKPFAHAALGGLLLALLVTAPGAEAEEPKGEKAMALSITSPAFQNKDEIPSRFTCQGKSLSPALQWTGAPEGAKSLALIVDDPDAPDPKAPRLVFVHWVLYNLPADSKGLSEAVSKASLPKGTLQGLNDAKKPGWTPPCPPIGRHRYFFKLYALDTTLPDLGKAATKADLEKAMQGHILEKAELIGTVPAKK
jgi:Raf kinase inhibitor-like YbhB/YbcL family protein